MTTTQFEAENEEKRNRDGRKKNLIKSYNANCSDEVFYVGSLDLNDPYSGSPIYVPSKQYLADIEAKEREAREQMDQIKEAENNGVTVDVIADDTSSANSGSATGSSGMSEEELRIANEIYQRLLDEAAADELAKQAEIDAIRQAQEEKEATDSAYNASTGSYSGLYGKTPMSQDEADALASIMNNNSSYTKSIEDLFMENN